jgi:hypothetical protein
LLTYSPPSASPDPLQISTQTVLSITVDNNTGSRILCKQIVFTLPVGTNAQDLIATASISPVPPSGWKAITDGGTVIFTAPDGEVAVEGEGLVFKFAVTTNNQPGSANIIVTETTADGIQRSENLAADKVPIIFTLTPISAVSTDILYGEPAFLSWTAAGQGVTCTLSYQPGDSADSAISITVPNTPDGPSYQTVPLTRRDNGDVDFVLIANQNIPGQDNPQPLQSSLGVTVEALSLSLEVQPATVGVGGLAQIVWDAPNADYCVTGDGQRLPPSGTAYVILWEQTNFTVTARGGTQIAQQQKLIQVSSAIVANQPGYSITGTAGAQGPTGAALGVFEETFPGALGFGFGTQIYQVNAGSTVAIGVQDGSGGAYAAMLNGATWPTTSAEYIAFQQAASGGTGAAGGDAVLTITLPPLDSSSAPAQVIPIALTGGTGGPGGTSGGYSDGITMGSYLVSMSGGDGGPGGNVRVEIAIDPTLAPAQYVFTLAGGAGGTGGTTGYGFSGNSGASGPPGAVALAFDGVIVPADGQLVAPRAFAPLVLKVAALPLVVAPNGVALLRWKAPGADYVVLPDGSVAPPNGKRYVVVAQTGPLTVTAHDQFGRTLARSATITVDPSILPTETGGSQTGGAGQAGQPGNYGSINGIVPSPPTPSSAGGTGGPGNPATVAMTVPPLDTSGTSTRVIAITAIGGTGGSGGAGGYLADAALGQVYRLPQTACPGGQGGTGGDATVTLTVDPSLPPAQLVVTVTPGAGGDGGQCGWIYNYDSSGGGATAIPGAPGTASLTIDGVAVVST